MPTILIDPGHGGDQLAGRCSPYGARGPSGVLEKDVTLALARSVAAHLGPDAALTRDGDFNLPLAERQARAQRAGARVFVSLHANEGPAGTRGSEVWVHPDAPPPSRGLGVLVERHLSALGTPARVRYGAPMAVLDPQQLGGMAAVLVEADYLSDPDGERRLTDPREVDRLGSAIASSVQDYLSRAPTPRSLGTPPRRTPSGGSTKAQGLAAVRTFSAGSGSSAFTGLARATVASRLQDLVNNPNLVQQGMLSTCGPAAFLHLWFKRDPAAAVRFGASLFATGSASIGSLGISAGSDLRRSNYTTILRSMGSTVTPQADWMMMSAIRDSENAVLDYEGRPDEDGLSAMTTPMELRSWLDHTGLYATVTDDANWAFTKSLAHARGLRPTSSRDVVMLINAAILGSASSGLASAFPNHFVPLYAPVTVSGSTVSFNVWTWGAAPRTYPASSSDFTANYYGAVIAG